MTAIKPLRSRCASTDLTPLIAVGLLLLADASTASAFDPVTVLDPAADVQLSVLGSFRGGYFSRSTPTYPVYDPATKRVFVGSDDRTGIDVIDVSNPAAPAKINLIDTSLWGDPGRLAYSQGVLATTAGGKVVFFNAAGAQIGSAINLPGASDLDFSPDGTKLVVTRGNGVSVLDVTGGYSNPPVTTASFSVYNSSRAQLLAEGVRLPLSPLPVASDLDTASLIVSPDSTTAWISLVDNNAIVKLDLATTQFTDIFGLGAKDNSLPQNALDPSDQDGGVHIGTWPIKSFYSPDGIVAYEAGGQQYLVTANEGDPRDPTSSRLADLTLDAVRFPNSAVLRQNANLGRLKVSNVDGDTDGDGDFDEIYALGGRSFSIWSTDGSLVFDSGKDFEQITAAAIPGSFNAAEDSNALDNRSDDRGPEPEGLAIGKIGDRSYAFVGFERISGIMVYDVTDPFDVTFQQYINNRNFAVNPATVGGPRGGLALPTFSQAGDLETEGITFIPATVSPLGVPMLAVTHEASDSMTLYRIDLTPNAPPSGDFDQDGDVDGGDFLTWQRGLGLTAGALSTQGDADHDRDVDAADLNVWRTAFGQPSVSAGAAVPEPPAIMLMFVVAAALGRVAGRPARPGTPPATPRQSFRPTGRAACRTAFSIVRRETRTPQALVRPSLPWPRPSTQPDAGKQRSLTPSRIASTRNPTYAKSCG